jgi:aminopeptidase N
VLTLPSESYIAEQCTTVDPQRIHAVRELMRRQLAARLHADWEWAFEAPPGARRLPPDAAQSGRRALANLALAMLVPARRAQGDPVWPGRAYQRVKDAGNMTDRLGALRPWSTRMRPWPTPRWSASTPASARRLLVIDKWFMLQATAPEPRAAGRPRVRARPAAAAAPRLHAAQPEPRAQPAAQPVHANPAAFHRTDAAGYVFWAERVLELDALNPQIAARVARAMDRWAQLAEPCAAPRARPSPAWPPPELSRRRARDRHQGARALEAT